MRLLRLHPLGAFAALCLLLSPTLDGQLSRSGRTAKSPSTSLLEQDDLEVSDPGVPATDPNGQPPVPVDPNAKKSAADLLAAMDFHAASQTLQTALSEIQKISSPELSEKQLAAETAAAALSGNWLRLREILSGIPEKETSGALYGALLSKLAAASEMPVASPIPQEMRYDSRPVRQDVQRRHLLVPGDVLGVLSAAPVPVNDTHLRHLKALCASAGPAIVEPLAKMLSTGIAGLGGQIDPEARTRAARLLLSSRSLDEAAAFLPLERDPRDSSLTSGQLVALIQYHSLKSAADKNEAPILRAAIACTALAERTDPKDSVELPRLTNSLLRFISQLEEGRAIDFLRNHILPRRELLDSVLNVVAGGASRDLASTNEQKRRERLSLIHRFLKGISVVQGGLPPTANSLALHWLDEAETSIRLSPPLKRSDGAREAIGRIYSFEPPTRNFLCFEREEVARLAPPEDFIVRLNPELAQRLRFARLRLAITDPEGDLTLEEFRSYVARHGRTGAGTLAEMFVRGWSEQRATPEEDPEVERLRNMGAFIPSAPKGLPQTRAVQEVTLREFKKLVVELEKIAGVPLKPEEKAAAFVRIHSPTEVFQLEQIESVFGPAENIDFSSLSTLLETMRGRLAGDWSDTGTQQKAGTHRTESEVIAEASRGYSLAADLIRRNKPRLEAGWKAHLQEAVLLFDAAEFHFKHQGALVDYVSERKSALEALEKTARNYIASVPNLRPSEWSLDPFLAWTSAMLGATDPKRLVWKENRAEPAFSKVHELLHSLPEPARTQHLRDFATLAHKTAETVPAHMRYKFVEALVQVIGAEIRELKPCLDLLQHYRSLTEEARLRAYFDGSKTVQHGQTFGVILALEHTEKLHREAGGFSKYLQNPGALNQNNPFVFFGLRNAKQMNYRDEFQKNIQKALQDAFEVISMTFHDPAVQPRPLPEAGWQATPLVYLALRTKDLSVDRLPPIQMDLEFAEGRAQVVLPIASQLEPMVTSTELLPPRPLQKLELLLTLDERDWVRGKLTLDINGKGHGVLPDLQTLFQSAELEGFTLTTAEQQNSVTQFVSDKDGLRAVCERNWQLTFQRKTDFHGDVMFRFPGMRDGIEGKVEYKHFVDADLFEIRSDKALGGIRLGRGRDTALRWTAGLVLVLALISGLIRWRHLWLPARAPVREGGPEVVTPLSVISFLRDQLEKADAVPIRECLQKSIRDLEERCFSARPNPPSESELLVKITTAREMLARSSST